MFKLRIGVVLLLIFASMSAVSFLKSDASEPEKKKIYKKWIEQDVSYLISTEAVSLQQVLATDNLVRPVFVTNAADLSNRLFIIEQGGIIKVLQPGATTTTDFLNITTKVLCCGERGLLGLAFHPNFISNRKFYVYYTRAGDGALQFAEYLASPSNPNFSDPATERVLFSVPHPNFGNHNGGTMEFGPDGYLYIGTGDGGSGNDPGNNAQNINSLLGKMLRVDVDIPQGSTQQYLIPPTNPFAGATAGADEIFMTGLRNPYRWTFDRANKNIMWIGDVGQDAVEEIDRIDLTQPPSTGSGARNLGWRIYEGNQCTNIDPCNPPTNNITPYATYSSASPSSRCSVTGGYAYRGKRGTFANGTYVHADYCTGEILTLPNNTQGQTPAFLLSAGFLVSSFGEDEAGELYVCRYSSTSGGIYKLVDNAVPMPRNEVADFDGDFRTDISVYRGGVWYTLNSFNQSVNVFQFGLGTDTPVPGDYDGDGKTDKAVWRGSDGNWYIFNSGNSTVSIAHWGQNGDRPTPGDFSGDKRNDYAIFRPTEGNWYIYNTSNNSFSVTNFGLSSDTTAQADYTGDGITDIAVFRPSTGVWYAISSNNGSAIITQFGLNGDTPVKGDFDGDNRNDIAVYRPSTGVWYALRSSNGTVYIVQFGISTDTPVPGDYDADDKTDVAVYRDGLWYILRSFNENVVIRQFGLAGDKPIPASY